MRALLNKIRRAFLSGNLISHYFQNKGFRVSISLLFGLVLNLVYLIFNFVSGIKYKSISFIAVSVYYALHICVRYIILKLSDSPDAGKAASACRKGGIFLLIADVLITPMLIFGAFTTHTASYSAPVLIFLGLYAVFALINASVGIAVSGKEKLPVRRAAYSVKLASGSVSVFNLLSALAASLIYDERILERITVFLGITVSFSVLCLSLAMIFSAVKTERSL